MALLNFISKYQDVAKYKDLTASSPSLSGSQENDYVKLDDEIYNRLKKDLMYTFKFKTSKDRILKGDLNKLFNSYKIEEIHYGIYK